MLFKKLAASASVAALAMALGSAAWGQEITGGVAGQVTENGKPAAGAQVRITNKATGVTVSTTSTDDGFYTVRNLPVGGPYEVKVTATDHATKTEQIDQLAIGQPYQLDVPIGGAVSEVVVTAAPVIRNATVQTGPRTTFTARDIQNTPSFNRDLHDLVVSNPFVTVDAANSNALIIAGANSHFNTIYLDGVRVSDDFGLNNNGYPTQRSPFSLEIVQAFNLEIAPYDVQYGDFEGGILNIVTKSGSNQFHGSVDYEYDASKWSGRSFDLAPATVRPVTTKFEDKDASATIGGPIWPDRIFFFFGYEQFQGLGPSTFSPSDVPSPNPIVGVTQANVTSVQNTVSAAAGGGGYGYNPLNFGGSAPITDTKYFGKIDFYITDNQHLFITALQDHGNQYNTPDASVSSKELNLASSDYIQAQNLDAYTADLISHWTPALSTEVEYVWRRVESPTTLTAGPFANFLIQLNTGGQIDLGPDISRQANNLGVTDQQARFRGHYALGDHLITAGYEWERLDTFDLFVQDATGAYTFNNTCGPGLGLANGAQINLQDHVACKLFYQNAFNNNPNTAAGTSIDYTDTVYAEDEWRISPELTVTGGLRYEWYSSPSKPLLNPRFVTQYNFANNATINGESILMPRAGFNWRPDPSLTITGGIGLFSGGNPGVYTYNSFDNPGNLLGSRTYTCSTANCATQASALTVSGATAGTPALINVAGSSIPTAVQNDITAAALNGIGNANALNPHFKPPSTWKVSLSVIKTVDFNDYSKWIGIANLLGSGWRFHGDLLATKVQDAVLWQDLWEEQNQLTGASAAALLGSASASPNGTAPDGRPLFNPTRYTNPLKRTSGFDLLLTDTNKGKSLIWAIGASKTWGYGLTIDYTYTHQSVTDVNPATSSVALSNYNNSIVADPNHPAEATSNYQIQYEHRLSFNYEHAFFGDNRTTLSIYLLDRAGLPFSYAFCTTSSSTCSAAAGVSTFSGNFDSLFGQSSTSTTHQLLYVPKGGANGQVTATSDPLVTYGPSFNLAQFNQFVQQSGLAKYEGRIAPRNAFKSVDVTTANLHFAQELPTGFPRGGKGQFYFDILNLGNLINKYWGIDQEVGFPYAFAPVVATNCQFSGKVFNGVTMPSCLAGQGNFYQFNTFRSPTNPANPFSTVQTLGSPPVATWAIKAGVRFKF